MNKEQGDPKNQRNSKLDGAIYDSRTSIEKKKNRRNQRLMKLVNRAQLTNQPSSKSPLIEKDDVQRQSARKL